MKNQALFSSKDKSKKLKCHLLQFLFGALRVKNSAQHVFPLDIIWLHAKVWLYGFHFGNILSLSHISYKTFKYKKICKLGVL